MKKNRKAVKSHPYEMKPTTSTQLVSQITMSSKQSTIAKKWTTADNGKLEQLVRQPGNGITLSSSKTNVKALLEHWPERKHKYKAFGALIRPKLQQLELDGYLRGGRAAADECLILL